MHGGSRNGNGQATRTTGIAVRDGRGSAKSAGHPFYQALNRLLAKPTLDLGIERRCQTVYALEEKRGHHRSAGRVFRMLLVGYFEGSTGQRGIAWRCADSLSLRQFLGIPLDKRRRPKTLSKPAAACRKRCSTRCFSLYCRGLPKRSCSPARPWAVDSTLLEADAA